jgi:hypothetical protein
MRKTLFSIVMSLMLIAAMAVPVFAADTLSASPVMKADAGLITKGSLTHSVQLTQTYVVECYGKDGQLKWRDEFKNLVPTEGLNKYLDCALKTGCSSPVWYVFLVTGPGSGTTYAAGDTLTGGHGGWTESSAYSETYRQTWTPGTITGGSVDNSLSKAQFSINAPATIAGAGMASEHTKGGSTGILLGAGDFSGGDRAVVSGDTINVQITASLTGS